MPDHRSFATSARPADLRPGQVWRDPKTPGLHLRAFESRSAWYLYYRLKDGTERRPKLGDARALTLSQAREIARQALAAAALGSDPHPRRQNAATAHVASPTVSDLWSRYWQAWALPRKKPRSRANDLTLWMLHVKPRIGHLAVADVTRGHVADLHAAMSGQPYNANRALALLRKMFALAVDQWEMRQTNPARGITPYPERSRKRLPSLDEVRAIMTGLDELWPSEPWFCGLVALLVFTGCRLREIMHARRDWIRDGALWLPDSKGGERPIVLSSYALAVIERLPVIEGNPYLIVGAVDGQPMKDCRKQWDRLMAAAGITDLRRHDLRRLFASTGLSSASLGLDAIGDLLGHKDVGTTRGYAWMLTPAKRAAAEAIGKAIADG